MTTATTALALKSFRLKNFKAIRDSGPIEFTPLTALIGNNGSGKSSLIEGLEALHLIVTQGLDSAMQQLGGFERVWHQGVPHDPVRQRGTTSRPYLSNPIEFNLAGQIGSSRFTTSTEIAAAPGEKQPFIRHEQITVKKRSNDSSTIVRDETGRIVNENHFQNKNQNGNHNGSQNGNQNGKHGFLQNESVISDELKDYISKWQFLSLNPTSLGQTVRQENMQGSNRLAKDGANIAEYLLGIQKADPRALAGIVEAVHYVLPYASDFYPAFTAEPERAAYLELTEGEAKLPGWLLSTGTLRIVALMAVLRNPNSPSLIVIEEIENGLDPSTVHMIVEEIRSAVLYNNMQIVITTHSPYLLDLLHISHLVLVERLDGQPTFTRPAKQETPETLDDWSRKFGPGELYTMGRLNRHS